MMVDKAEVIASLERIIAHIRTTKDVAQMTPLERAYLQLQIDTSIPLLVQLHEETEMACLLDIEATTLS